MILFICFVVFVLFVVIVKPNGKPSKTKDSNSINPGFQQPSELKDKQKQQDLADEEWDNQWQIDWDEEDEITAHSLVGEDANSYSAVTRKNQWFQVYDDNLNYNWYAIYKYYPTNRYPKGKLPYNLEEERNMVYSFKNGADTHKFAELFDHVLSGYFGKAWLEDKVLVIVPASSRDRTDRRFKKFCVELCSLTGMENGYNFVSNNEYSKTPSSSGGARDFDLEDYVEISEEVNGSNILVIDDVRTSGASSNKLYKLLQDHGAIEITFVYLARTV
jgi:hypothetical protein